MYSTAVLCFQGYRKSLAVGELVFEWRLVCPSPHPIIAIELTRAMSWFPFIKQFGT